MSNTPRNLLSDLPQPTEGEVFEDLLRRGRVSIERIVSSQFPEPVLYDQPQDEWVLLLQGEARLWVAEREFVLTKGDSLFIPARTPHRVLSTSANPPCVWVAVHMERPARVA
jgi:cupin 2 domain-containing protein